MLGGEIMKLLSTLAGLAMLGGVTLSPGTASAMPVMNPNTVAQTGLVQQAALVCNDWGHCWHRPSYGYYHHYGYYHPHYHGGWGWRWHPHYWGWHPHYYGGWGWHRWHHWHYW
jgi:hypothetical protein